MAARSTAEWMIHPSNFVFKSLEDSMIKPPFSSFSTPHIVPEKIVESFVDQNGLRCYRVKWLDSWLTEQHINATFPHLITEYWINKPINESEYQNVAQPQQQQLQQQQQQQQQQTQNVTAGIIPQTGSFAIASATTAAIAMLQAKPSSTETIMTVTSEVTTTEKTIPTPSTLHHMTSLQSSSAMSVPQLFTNTGKPNSTETPVSNEVSNNDVDNASIQQKSPEDFVVESLKLPEQIQMKHVPKASKDDISKPLAVSNVSKPLIPLLPKLTAENQVQFLLSAKDAAALYNFNPIENKDKDKTPVANFPKMSPISVFSNTFNQLQQQFSHQPAISLPTMEQINQAQQQFRAAQVLQHNLQQTIEKKQAPVPKKVTTPKVKADPTTKNKGKEPVPCDICGKMISSRKNLRVHKTVRHFKNGSFACQICDRKFALNRDLQRHMPLHTNERKYICQYCGLQCKQPGHLTKHLRTHTEVMNWRCDCCFKNFRVQADLKEHCFKEHADIKDKNLKCSVCQEKLKLPNSVYLHSLRHSGVREFSCDICKATFKLKQHMQVHMKTHEKPKETEKVPCPICEKIFKSKIMFEKHVEKHTETTADEYKENLRLLAEEKKQKKKSTSSSKRKLKSSVSSSDNENEDEEEVDLKISAKRKQRKPNKVLYDEDLDTKLVVRKKFTEKERHICTTCKDSFRSKVLLKSHMKLHAQELENEKAIVDQIEENDGNVTKEGVKREDEVSNEAILDRPDIETSETDGLVIETGGQQQSTDNNSSTILTSTNSETNDLSFIADACESISKEILQIPGIASSTTSSSSSPKTSGTLSLSESNALNKAALILQGEHNNVG